MNFWTAVISLFLVLNAIGCIPLFVGLLVKFNAKKQRAIIIREMLLALLILILFGLFGEKILNVLNINKSIIEIAGGFLLVLVAVRMLFPLEKQEIDSLDHEPILVPLAVPTIAGPGAITTTIIIHHALGNAGLVMSVIFIAWFFSLIILLAASTIKYVLSDRGMIGLERFGGMIIILIAMNMLVNGIVETVKINFSQQKVSLHVP
ncbi:MAG: MarC family protein [Chlamydiales bacterium]|nr:MarC family protein [Chlamydiales bacterium]